jgi:thiamine-phosphate pyrophosphorylase
LPVKPKTKRVNRIIDANINRAKEGLRVCEEVTRFILDSRGLTSRLKGIRHRISVLADGQSFLEARDSLGDVGKGIYLNELKRKGFKDIFFANIQRAKESIRVLEEFSKLLKKNTAVEFKKMRYELYEIEKCCAKRLAQA